ncbi:hypothetical protein KIN20_004394 [Parelaphostrongylus tenuis]|uniref:Uncharacterized protein n=1 Tax=Parelaphostrongylus tenuis TaxID=148309 RepID=A0AAD5MGZ1_PARTN|nr:hypothetical protein KIN20_004394 [Parelaphostrongylus tenuis]
MCQDSVVAVPNKSGINPATPEGVMAQRARGAESNETPSWYCRHFQQLRYLTTAKRIQQTNVGGQRRFTLCQAITYKVT